MTRKGLPNYLTLDNLYKISEAKGLHVCASHFFDRKGMYPKGGATLNELVGLQETSPMIVLCGLRDPLKYNINLYANTKKPSKSEGESLSVDSEAGVTYVSHEMYMNFVKHAQPDLCLSLSDEVFQNSGKKRISKAMQRTIDWLGKSVADFDAAAADTSEGERVADGAKQDSDALESVGLVASIVASSTIEENVNHAKSAATLASDNAVGYAIMGLGLRESDSFKYEALRAMNRELPKSHFRYASGSITTPLEILQAIECGIDIVDTSFVHELTSAGMAMVFDLDPDASTDSEADDINLNLWSDEYVHDQRILKAGCECYTCRQGFTRGYIHHLLQCRELLAQVLLEIHNTDHMMKYFKCIRSKISSGGFERYLCSFLERTNILIEK